MTQTKITKTPTIEGLDKAAEITLEDLELISKFTRKKPSASELYTFTLTLCDNEIDRDNERFSLKALEELRGLFVGVTGIFDHSMKSCDQTARVYDTYLQTDSSRKTEAGEQYTALKAKCYMLRTPKNQELIDDIELGIKKEVSVSCSVSKKLCSVCGEDIRSSRCSHLPGEKIHGKTCHAVLDEPTDAYEWSFVAVPAQKNAGVTKKLSLSKDNVLSVKSNENDDIVLTASQFESITKALEESKNATALVFESAKRDIIALSAFTMPSLDTKCFSQILDKLSLDEILMLKKSFSERAVEQNAYEPTLTRDKAKENNKQFKL